MAEHNKAAVTHAVAGASAANAGMRPDIIGRWGKLSAQEIGALTNTEDLVKLVQEKYSLDKAQAQRDVDTFARGRAL